jgi:hypothetical protein
MNQRPEPDWAKRPAKEAERRIYRRIFFIGEGN